MVPIFSKVPSGSEFKPHNGLLTLNTLTYLSSIHISDQYCFKKVQNNQMAKRFAAYRNSQLLGLGSEVIFLSVIFTFYPALSKLVISFTPKFLFRQFKEKRMLFQTRQDLLVKAMYQYAFFTFKNVLNFDRLKCDFESTTLKICLKTCCWLNRDLISSSYRGNEVKIWRAVIF